ncbi:MAG TPA: endonuclease V [Solirubrobacteraceae bacterium]|nr:endonuclease V [Solirubrobacteraceae bacterium]
MTPWPASAAELIDAQHALAATVPDAWEPPAPGARTVGACVVVFARGQTGRGARGDPAWAAAAVLRRRHVLAQATVVGEAAGPYVPGLLALREGPCLEAAVRALALAPDVLLVDATGADHPRRAGLASQLGAVTGLATVGVTHRPLLARGPWPRDVRGAHAPLSLDGACVGAWLRTRAGARPVAVHPGWRTTLDVAIDVVLSCSLGHRTPEPFRHARTLARIARATR